MKYEIVPIEKLRPLEKVFPTHFKNLENMINSDGFILKAIIADKKTGTILDGSHRYVYFLKYGYKEVPVYFTDYSSDDTRVGTLLEHRFLIKGSTGISKRACLARAESGDLFSPRTTRHFFTFRKFDISLPLSQLKKGGCRDVSNLIADVSIFEEIEYNKKYISEIESETNIIIKYLSEVSETKEYLEKQVEKMDATRQVAFFPGKFHPPHIGHIQTILNIMPKYRKIIIGVSEHTPDQAVTTPNYIITMLKDFFKAYENVEIFKIKNVLVERDNIEDLPAFDVLLSGNEDVINWANRMGIKNEYTPRSAGPLCSGTEIRNKLLGESF